jgi:hypothetical protein
MVTVVKGIVLLEILRKTKRKEEIKRKEERKKRRSCYLEERNDYLVILI